MQKCNQTSFRQNGAVLIFMAFIMVLAATTYLVNSLDPARQRLEQDKKTMQTLNAAKQALIAWSVSHPFHPGQMPFPDRGTGGGYDGKSDCNPPNNNPLQYSFLIGQLPIYGQTNPCVSPQIGIGGNFQDAQGSRLWYAVSRNLTHKYETDPLNANPVEPIINPSVINNPMYPWLKVLDRNGTLISDSVAAVIIAPGDPVGGQSRTVLSPPSEFLDQVIIGGNTYKNFDYTKPDEDFIIGEDSRNVSGADATFVQPYNFNDKLVYITIDELISALNNRAAGEANNLLKLYKVKTGQFPYAANLGASLGNNISLPPNQAGALPIDVTDTCSCTITTATPNCTCSFKVINSVIFTKNSGTWQTALGCTRSGNLCTCKGAGYCRRGAVNFTCTSAGFCSTTQTGVNLFTYSLPNHADAKPDFIGCFFSGTNPACNNDGTFTVGLKESAWFRNNFWQDYFYYEWSSPPNLQVGGKTGVSALLIGTGQAIGLQNRPPDNATPSLNDYLDSAENTDGNLVFDATNKQKNSNYNDQTYIVAP